MSGSDPELGFAVEFDVPIPYLQRDPRLLPGRSATARPTAGRITPRCRFTRWPNRSAECRIALITTAAPYQPDKGDQGPGASYNAAAKFYQVYSGDTARDHDLRISHVAYDRAHTTAEDANTWFPLPQLRLAAAAGRIGAVAPRFHGAPTNRSQRVTLDAGLPGAAGALPRRPGRRRDIGAELPGLPPDHQSGRPPPGRARHRDGGHGMRQGHRRTCRRAALFVQRLPARQLGRAAERPASQAFTLELALRVLETAPAPRTTVQSPLRWSDDPSWKLDYSNIERLSADGDSPPPQRNSTGKRKSPRQFATDPAPSR